MVGESHYKSVGGDELKGACECNATWEHPPRSAYWLNGWCHTEHQLGQYGSIPRAGGFLLHTCLLHQATRVPCLTSSEGSRQVFASGPESQLAPRSRPPCRC